MPWGPPASSNLPATCPAFDDNMVHPTINVSNLDPECALPNMVINKPAQLQSVSTILNNSFGMVGINSVIIVKKYERLKVFLKKIYKKEWQGMV